MTAYLDQPRRSLDEVLSGRFAEGDRVRHADAGPGTIRRFTTDRRYAVVAFDDGLRFTVWLGDIVRLGAAEPPR